MKIYSLFKFQIPQTVELSYQEGANTSCLRFLVPVSALLHADHLVPYLLLSPLEWSPRSLK